jgi:phosphate:Na+ symporter
MQESTAVVNLVGGLMLMQYGTSALGHELKAALGPRLRGLIENTCGTRFSAICSGFAATFALNSATAMSLLTVDFADCGVLTTRQGVGVFLGVNIGTTLVLHMVALKNYSLAMCAAARVLGLRASKSSPRAHAAEALFGAGLMFLGMDLMGAALKPIQEYAPFVDFLVCGSLHESRSNEVTLHTFYLISACICSHL